MKDVEAAVRPRFEPCKTEGSHENVPDGLQQHLACGGHWRKCAFLLSFREQGQHIRGTDAVPTSLRLREIHLITDFSLPPNP